MNGTKTTGRLAVHAKHRTLSVWLGPGLVMAASGIGASDIVTATEGAACGATRLNRSNYISGLLRPAPAITQSGTHDVMPDIEDRSRLSMSICGKRVSNCLIPVDREA